LEADIVDLSKLTTSDKVIAGSGIVLFIASFLPWFKAEAGGFEVSGNGWDVGFIWAGLPAILGLLAAAAVLLKANGTELPTLPVSWGQAFLAAGAISAFFVILKLLIGEDSGFGIEVSRAWGIFVATIAAAGLAYGGFLKFQEDKGSSSAI
jgi:hypothetical protein